MSNLQRNEQVTISNSQPSSQPNKQRIIHSKPVLVSPRALYEFIQFDCFGTQAFNVSKVIYAISKRFPVINGRIDIAASVWLAYSGIEEISYGKLKAKRISESMIWLVENGFIDVKKVGRTTYRALSQKAISMIKDYESAITTIPDVGNDLSRMSGMTIPEVGSNRDSDQEKKNIDSRGNSANKPGPETGIDRSGKRTHKGPESSTKKATTTKFPLVGFYEVINKVTGHATAQEKNKMFQVELDKYGPDFFGWALKEMADGGVKFVWHEPVEKHEFACSDIPNLFSGLEEELKAGR
jgi:hypothetical protein